MEARERLKVDDWSRVCQGLNAKKKAYMVSLELFFRCRGRSPALHLKSRSNWQLGCREPSSTRLHNLLSPTIPPLP